MKHVEAPVAALVKSDWPGDLVHLPQSTVWFVKLCEECQVTLIRRIHEFTHDTQAVYGLAHGSIFHRAGPVAMVHPTVVSEEANIVGGGLDAEHQTMLVVHLN